MLVVLSSQVWSDIWFVTTTRVDFWNWIRPARHGRVQQKVECRLQCYKNSTWFFTGLTTLVLPMWKWIGLLWNERHILKMLGLSFSSKLVPSFDIVSIAATASEKTGAFWYSPAWNTVVMSGMVLLATTWICQIIYGNRYLGPLILHLLPLLNPWLIIKM